MNLLSNVDYYNIIQTLNIALYMCMMDRQIDGRFDN